MVMTHLPAFHVWKFLMKNMIPTNSSLVAAIYNMSRLIHMSTKG